MKKNRDMGHKYGIGDVVYSTIWNEDVRIIKLNDNLFYTVRSINRYDWMMTHEGNLKSREDVIEKMTQEHQDVCDETLTIQGIDTSEFEMIDEEFEYDLIPKFGEYSDNEPLDILTMMTEFVKEHGLPCPEGYQFVDENGNIINATKIVLEKKKKEYPKTFKECQDCLGEDVAPIVEPISKTHRRRLVHLLEVLLACRDAYWKIAGEEMGLGKPWEPDWEDENQEKYIIGSWLGTIQGLEENFVSHPFAFPTEEMRDAFYENFKEEIESCKELL